MLRGLGLVVLAAVVVACASDDGADVAAPGSTEPAPPAAEPGPEPPDTEAEPNDTFDTRGDEDVDDELVIVDIADFTVDLTALGSMPVANVVGPEFLAGTIDVFDLTEEQQAAILSAENVAPAFVLNVERVVELDPDLILTSEANEAFWADPLEQLGGAFDVTVIGEDLTWQERSRTMARFVGAEDLMEERIVSAETALVDTAARVEEMGLAGTEVSVLWAFEPALSAMVEGSLAATVLDAVGLTQPAAQRTRQPPSSIEPEYAAAAPIAGENLGDHDADALVILNTADVAADEWPAGYARELLPVLEEGPVIVTAYFGWTLNTATGVLAINRDINRLLDEFE
ncbi:MAG: hypothetical protein AAGF02_11100 [Actinomycetota bacterium]